MVKIKKHQLLFEPEYNYEMIGISSHHHGYRLAWNINANLEFDLCFSSEPFTVVINKKGISERNEFTMFDFDDESNRVHYYLIKNKEYGKILVPEKPTIDYFLFVHENDIVDCKALCAKLQEVPSILGVFPIDPETIASAENIVF